LYLRSGILPSFLQVRIIVSIYYRKIKAQLLILSPLGRQCEKDHVYTWMLHYYVEGFFMAKKGTTFNTYSNEIKLSAVQSYLNGEGSYDMVSPNYKK
jgi:hypothetical protein